MLVLLDSSAWIVSFTPSLAASISIMGGAAAAFTALYFTHAILKISVDEQEYPYTSAIAKEISNGKSHLLLNVYNKLLTREILL